MEAPSPPVMTIGMHVDAVLERLDSLSSTQLYGMIVLCTVFVSFWLLGNPSPEELQGFQPHVNTTKPSKDNTREPRWHILRWLNYAALVGFGVSVYKVALHGFDKQTMMYYLVGWSLFLCYFFGFFGISFVPADILRVSSDEGTEETSTTHPRSLDTTTTKTTTSSPKKKALHPPAHAAPVCADPSSLTKTKLQIADLSDDAIASLVLNKQVKDHELEQRLDCTRAVQVRRLIMQTKLDSLGHVRALENLPQTPSLDYTKVHGANCEIVVGYVPLPVGLVGPLTVNNESVYIPMATTEGCLVASTNRGCKALSSKKEGVTAIVLRDGITRAPCLRMPSAAQAAYLKLWAERPENFQILKRAFESTTSFGKLTTCSPTVAGKNVYLRLVCNSGDAMGMNMISKGSLAVIQVLKEEFPDLTLVALSGNMCTDKKAAATNWLHGRGKSVVAEAVVPKEVVRTTLKTTVQAMVHTNLQKNLIGSAMAGVVGGFNAHAANIVTAVFLATGQDPAQNVESSNCITLLEETTEGDLHISVTMPSIEVGTVGGGTSLEAQKACLSCMGVQGGSRETPGANAQKLATLVAAATMAGELSLLAALAANTLVQAHMQHNRKPQK